MKKEVTKSKVIDSVFIKKIYKQGAYTSIMNLPWSENNLFHWNIDCLPRLLPITKNKRKKNTFYMQWIILLALTTRDIKYIFRR